MASLSFAELLASLTVPGTSTPKVEAGAVQACPIDALREILPSLYSDTVAPTWDGKSKFFLTPSGHVCTVRRESDGNLIVNQPGVEVTPAMAKRILDDFAEHNRRSTQSAIDRYATAMSAGQWKYVGNTAIFVVGLKANNQRFMGQANGGHTFKAIVKSGVPATVDFTYGVQEQWADRLDVNIARSPKDVIGRRHRYDSLAGQSQIDGRPLGRTFGIKDVATLDNVHSQALRLLACILAHKPAKDSEPLGPTAIAELDNQYGHLLMPAVIQSFLLNKNLFRMNAKGTKKVDGGLSYYVSLSHCAALATVASVERDDFGKLIVANDVLDACFAYLATIGNEADVDATHPGVALRQAINSWRAKDDKRASNQNYKFRALKLGLKAAMENSTLLTPAVLSAIEPKTIICFDTVLDTPPKEENPKSDETVEELIPDELEEELQDV